MHSGDLARQIKNIREEIEFLRTFENQATHLGAELWVTVFCFRHSSIEMMSVMTFPKPQYQSWEENEEALSF